MTAWKYCSVPDNPDIIISHNDDYATHGFRSFVTTRIADQFDFQVAYIARTCRPKVY